MEVDSAFNLAAALAMLGVSACSKPRPVPCRTSVRKRIEKEVFIYDGWPGKIYHH